MGVKHSKFVELAEKRVNKCLKQMKLISNLANRSNYDYTEEDYNKIFKALDAEIKVMKTKFLSSSKSKSGFSLKE